MQHHTYQPHGVAASPRGPAFDPRSFHGVHARDDDDDDFDRRRQLHARQSGAPLPAPLRARAFAEPNMHAFASLNVPRRTY